MVETLNDPAISNERSRRISAGALSAVIHLVAVFVLAWILHSAPRGATSEPDRTGGIVLVKQRERKIEYFTEAAETASEGSESGVDALSSSLPNLNELNADLPGFLPADDEFGKIGAELGKDLKGADGFLDGIGTDPKTAPNRETSTQLFGIQGTGTKFVYVFDRSGSMASYGGRPLAAAKGELLASLDSLGPNQQFQIIFYNERPRAFTPSGGKPKLMFGTPENLKAAEKFISGVGAGGQTNHIPALRMAVDFAPDVVFFLTDADEPTLSAAELDSVDRWNRNAAAIHAIEFGERRSATPGNFLQKLARQSGGRYTYRDLTLLGSK